MINIKPQLLLEIEELFISKKWPISSGTETKLSLYDKFCLRINLLKAHEQKFIIDLTKKFIRIGLKDYLEKFYESIFCLKDEIFEIKENIFVYPLINPYIEVKKELISNNGHKDVKVPRGKIKSGAFLHYMFETDEWTWITNKFIHSTSLKLLNSKFNNEDSVLLLIDDFVGSGKTAVETCKVYLNEEFGGQKIDPSNVKIVCIAAQKEGIEHVKSTLGIDVISNIHLDRGLSDYHSDDELISRLHMMTTLETEIGVPQDYNLGYEKSESLISFLNKTPNNTFPVYWWETKSKVAPFPRYNKFKIDGR